MKETRIHALIMGSGTAGPALSLFLKKAGSLPLWSARTTIQE